MAERFSGPLRKSGDVKASADLRALGKQLVGEMRNQQRLGGPATAVRYAQLPDGSGVVARLVNGQPQVDFYPGGLPKDVELEEVIYMYISSPGGLRIFDLGLKRLAQTITGLSSYELIDVSDDLRYVYMVGGGLAVRVDTQLMTAFGYANYPAIIWDTDLNPDAYNTLRASPDEGKLSPDGTRLLLSYDRIYDPATSVVREGLGGFLLADSTTLAPLRSSIRMSQRRQTSAWAPDSQKFYISTKTNVDGGGYPPHDPYVADYQTDYVCVFSRDGVLLGSRLLATWNFVPGAGFRNLIEWIEPNHAGTRIYVTVAGTWNAHDGGRLIVLDATDNSLPIIADVQVTASDVLDVGQAAISNDDTRLVVRTEHATEGYSEVVEFDVSGVTPVEIGRYVDPLLATSAGGNTEVLNRVLRAGPRSRAGARDDSRWFLLREWSPDAHLHGYRTLGAAPVYALDIKDTVFPAGTGGSLLRYRYALKNAGIRPKRIAA